MNIQRILIPKTNYNEGRGQYRPEIIVIHIGDGSKEAIISEFKNPNTQKSSNLLSCNDGTMIRFVEDKDTAFTQGEVHNPTAKWVLEHKGLNPNNCALSIEHEGKTDISEAAYRSDAEQVKEWNKKYLIPLDSDHIIRHRTINTKKLCPGLINVERIIKLAQALVIAEKGVEIAKVATTLPESPQKISFLIVISGFLSEVAKQLNKLFTNK